jgi:chemotaxis signal transduction protein
MDNNNKLWITCRISKYSFAIPIEQVIEVMRPLPVETISGIPSFVSGLSVIRGSPVPVIDTGLLLTGREARSGCLARFIHRGLKPQFRRASAARFLVASVTRR